MMELVRTMARKPLIGLFLLDQSVVVLVHHAEGSSRADKLKCSECKHEMNLRHVVNLLLALAVTLAAHTVAVCLR